MQEHELTSNTSATLWPAGDGAIRGVCLDLAAAGLSPPAPCKARCAS